MSLSLSSWASHIAGGEFSYTYIGKLTSNQLKYRIRFTLYQDCKNGTPAAIKDDNPATFTIFKKSTSSILNTQIINASVSGQKLGYGVDPYCYDNLPALCLQKTVFNFDVLLPAESSSDFDPSGYVISYQRCCRNGVISNISNPGVLGSTFYTSLPARESQANNSPKYNAPPPLIICMNYPQRIDYSASDVDGDSLVYRLCSTNAGASSSDPKPNMSSPPPFPPVVYNAGYSSTNPVGSSPAPNISPKKGLLEFTPDRLGIFAVVICIDEYRNGQLLAVHRRETQFYVTNCSKKSYASIPVLSFDAETHQIVCDDYAVSFTNNSVGAASYFWDFGDPSSSADTSSLKFPYYIYPDTGTYTVNLYTDMDKQCPDSVSKAVKIYPYFKAHFTVDGRLCAGEEIEFRDSSFSTYGKINSYFWDLGDDSYIFDEDTVRHSYQNRTTSYEVVMIAANEFGCRDTAYKSLDIYGVDVFAGNDTTLLVNSPSQIGARGEANSSWSPALYMDDPNTANPIFTFPKFGVYTYVLTSYNELGCMGQDTVTITVTPEAYFFIPTAFTPNSDGLNDIVEIITAGIRGLVSFDIYNRWGQNIFNTTNIKSHWDGRFRGQELPIGTYFWVAEALGSNNERVHFSGEINLLR